MMPHGHNMHKTATDMATETMCPFRLIKIICLARNVCHAVVKKSRWCNIWPRIKQV